MLFAGVVGGDALYAALYTGGGGGCALFAGVVGGDALCAGAVGCCVLWLGVLEGAMYVALYTGGCGSCAVDDGGDAPSGGDALYA